MFDESRVNRVRVKICGLSRMEDIAFVNAALPDYVGFVFAEKSRRRVAFDEAAALRGRLARGIIPVGVFVNREIRDVAALVDKGVIDVVQLHGDEDEGYIERLRAVCRAPVVKAFRVSGAEDVRAAEDSGADYLLFDGGFGGTGTAFPWELVSGVSRPYFLAGGLNAQNIGEAVKKLRPFAVDISSGVETDGLKDGAKITEIVRMIRNER